MVGLEGSELDEPLDVNRNHKWGDTNDDPSDDSNFSSDDDFQEYDDDCNGSNRRNEDYHNSTLNLNSDWGWLFEHAARGELHGVIDAISKDKALVDCQTPDGHTLLMIACDRGHLAMVKYLVSQDADIDKQNNFGNTALICACSKGHVSIARYLMENDCKITTRQRDGKTALMIVSQIGHRETCKLFVRTSIVSARNRSTKTHGKTRSDTFDPSRAINIDMRDFDGKTSLIISISQSHTIIAKILLSSGANADIKDNRGWNALIWAIIKRQKSVASICLQCVRDIDVGDNEGTSPLMYACRYGMKDTYVELIALGCDIDARNIHGDSALHEACKGRATENVKYMRDDLIKKGAKLNAYNKQGKSALDFLPCATEEERLESETEKKRLGRLAKHVNFFWFLYYQFLTPRKRRDKEMETPMCGEINCL